MGKEWDEGYKAGITEALAVVSRANIDKNIKNNFKSKFRKILQRIKVGEPKVRIDDIDEGERV